MQEKHRSAAFPSPQPHATNQGTWPETQACALTGNQTNDLSVCRTTPNPWSHASQGYATVFLKTVNNETISLGRSLNVLKILHLTVFRSWHLCVAVESWGKEESIKQIIVCHTEVSHLKSDKVGYIEGGQSHC